MKEEGWQALHQTMKSFEIRNAAARQEQERQDVILSAHMQLLLASKPESTERYDAFLVYARAMLDNAHAHLELGSALRRTSEMLVTELPKMKALYDA